MQRLDSIISEVVRAILDDKPLPEEKKICWKCGRERFEGDTWCDFCEQMKMDYIDELKLQDKQDTENSEEYQDDED
jgi:hypothetical protein